jgi:hypothetical protein
MSFSSEFQRQIGSFFGMRTLNTNSYEIKDENGNVVDRFQPTSYWVAQTRYFRPQDGKALTIAVIHTKSWMKGIILIPPIVAPFDRSFGGPANLSPVILNGTEDSVFSALKSVDLTYSSDYVVLDGLDMHFNMLVVTGNSIATLSLRPESGKNASLDKLWAAITKTIYELVDKYDDHEFNEFIDPRTNYW